MARAERRDVSRGPRRGTRGSTRAQRRREERAGGKPGGATASAGGAGRAGLAWAVVGVAGILFGVMSAYLYASVPGGVGGLLFSENGEGLLRPGARAPAFEAPTVDGGRVSVGARDPGGGEARMLVFFASWCPHCKKDAPIVRRVEREYAGDLEVVMVGVDAADDAKKARSFARGHGILGPVVHEPDLKSRYRAASYPTVYVLDAEDRIVSAHAGEAPEWAYRGWVEEALSGAPSG